MKWDHEKTFRGYAYINKKYQKLQDKCCLKSILNLEISFLHIKYKFPSKSNVLHTVNASSKIKF
jgi:hypothetical protein